MKASPIDMNVRVLVVLAGISVLGWTAQAQQAQPSQPVFRSGVQLVRLDVRVVDGSDRPITDLRPEEIEISEDGVRRPVVLFQRVASATESYVESAQRTIGSDVSTNQGAPQGQLFVLVFDQDHIRAGAEQPVRAAAATFLRERVRRHDRVAIYGLPGPGPAQPFTANSQAALKQLDLVRGGLERRASGAVTDMTVAEAYEIVRGNEQVLARFTTVNTAESNPTGGASGSDRVQRFAEDRAVLRRLIQENAQSIVTLADADARRFLQSMGDVLRGLRGIDGRKTVLLFSEGFYGANVGRELEEVAAAAAETYAVIHAFDLNRRIDLTATERSTAEDGVEILNRIEPLGSLAAETSGALIKDAGVRLESAFASLLPDDASYYLIGFEPAAPDLGDSLYRRVKVRIGRAGARAISRTGYARGAAPTPADRRRAIDAALAAPFTQQGLRVDYTTYVGQATSPGLQRVAVSLVAELPVLPAGSGGGSTSDNTADVVFLVRDSRTGRGVASGSERIALPAQAEGGFSTGASRWRVAFDLPAGDYIMRCIVREPGGVVGSADRRFTVRSLTGFDVAASDLLLASADDPLPVRARAYTGASLTGTTRLYAKTAEKLEQAGGRVELLPLGVPEGGSAAGRGVRATFGPVLLTPTGAMRDVIFALPLSGLEAGPYVARAVVQVGGETVADLRRPVDVVIGEPPAVSSRPASGSRPSDVLDGESGRRLIKALAASPRANVRVAAGHLDRHEFAAALSVASSTPDAESARLRGLAQLGQQNYADAAATLGAEFDAHPQDADVAFVLGWARRGAGDVPGALGAFRSAAHLQPRLVAAHLALAGTYVSVGESALAIQALNAGLGHLPDSPELRAMLELIRKD
jgi:VWFA-related protein